MLDVVTYWNCVLPSFQRNSDHVPGCPRMSQDVPGCPRMSQDQDRPESVTHFKPARQALSWRTSAFAIAPASRGALLRSARGPLVQQHWVWAHTCDLYRIRESTSSLVNFHTLRTPLFLWMYFHVSQARRIHLFARSSMSRDSESKAPLRL